MSSKGQYQFAILVDSVLLWGRLGGKFAVFAVVVWGILGLIPTIPSWLAPSALLAAFVLAMLAILRLLPYLAVRKNGVIIEGHVSDIEEERSRQADLNHLSKRINFRYEINGQEYTGQTTWASSGKFGTLGIGNPIPLLVDPARPQRAFWTEDVPLQMPQVIGL